VSLFNETKIGVFAIKSDWCRNQILMMENPSPTYRTFIVEHPDTKLSFIHFEGQHQAGAEHPSYLEVSWAMPTQGYEQVAGEPLTKLEQVNQTYKEQDPNTGTDRCFRSHAQRFTFSHSLMLIGQVLSR
jgi:hypothetical protein